MTEPKPRNSRQVQRQLLRRLAKLRAKREIALIMEKKKKSEEGKAL